MRLYLNDYHDKGFPDYYPGYLLEETEEVKIIDPASAALGITVGSIAQEYGPSDRHPGDILFSPAQTHHPSPFTRVGPGYKEMIKPEVVEEGGNIIQSGYAPSPDIGGKLVTLNPRWLQEGRLFTVKYGTSLSAPKVANYIARLFNKYPHYSPNLIKALLIASSQIPEERPDPLSQIKYDDPDKELTNILNVYGYGKPNLDKAMFSDGSRVLLRRDNAIKLDGVHLYYFDLPREFVSVSGLRRLSMVLVYDPPVNKNRIDYMGCSMEFHLFKNMEEEEVERSYKRIQKNMPSGDDVIPEELQLKEIKLHPGINRRKRGVHQKGVVEYKRISGLDTDKPLVLAVLCQNRWIKEADYLQDYTVIVTAEHSQSIDLFNKVRIRNQERIRVTV